MSDQRNYYNQGQYYQQDAQYYDQQQYSQPTARHASRQPAREEYQNDFQRLQASNGGVGKYGVFGAVSIILAAVEVMALPVVAPLWLQDVFCLAAICFGACSAVCSQSKAARWMAFAGVVIAACALVGTMSTHSMYGVLFQAIGSMG